MEFDKFIRVTKPNRGDVVRARGLSKAQGLHGKFQINKSDIGIGGGERHVTTARGTSCQSMTQSYEKDYRPD